MLALDHAPMRRNEAPGDAEVIVVPAQRLHNVSSAVKYITLKVDVSTSMHPSWPPEILRRFINATFTESIGEVFMKIVAFSGRRERVGRKGTVQCG